MDLVPTLNLLSKDFLSSYYEQDTAVGTGITEVNKRDLKIPVLWTWDFPEHPLCARNLLDD